MWIYPAHFPFNVMAKPTAYWSGPRNDYIPSPIPESFPNGLPGGTPDVGETEMRTISSSTSRLNRDNRVELDESILISGWFGPTGNATIGPLRRYGGGHLER